MRIAFLATVLGIGIILDMDGLPSKTTVSCAGYTAEMCCKVTQCARIVRDKKEERMKHRLVLRVPILILVGLVLCVLGGVAMGIEEAAYTVEKTDGDFEVRLYAPRWWPRSWWKDLWKKSGTRPSDPCFATSQARTNRSQNSP